MLKQSNEVIYPMINREQAIGIVEEHVSNENLVKHMIGVGAIMKGLAENLDEDPQLWEVVGILHDVDYEETSEDFSKHGLRSAEMVKDYLPKEALHAIKAHNPMTGVEAESNMDISLFAADAVSGIIVANALVRPSGLEGMKPGSVKRRMKDSSFARQVSRENIMRAEELGITLNEFLKLSLDSMKEVRNELGL
jgi:hypothetical protein